MQLEKEKRRAEEEEQRRNLCLGADSRKTVDAALHARTGTSRRGRSARHELEKMHVFGNNSYLERGGKGGSL